MLIWLLTIAAAGAVAVEGDTVRADDIFTTGPETLVESAAAVIAGPVSDYEKRVQQSTADSSHMPLRWEIVGVVAQPEVIKGAAPKTPIRFTHQEQSVVLPTNAPAGGWESDYGEWQPQDRAVIFLDRSQPPGILRAVPSGKGERDFVSLVKEIAAIQVKPSAQRPDEWRRYLSSAPSDGGRKAALRALIAIPANWAGLAPLLEQVMESHAGLRTYTFGIVAYGLTRQKWADASKPLDFLCRRFSAETDPDLAIQYVQHFKLIARFANEEAFREARKPLRQQLRTCLQQQSARRDANVAEECRQILTQYPD
jgi:hypothetical protein